MPDLTFEDALSEAVGGAVGSADTPPAEPPPATDAPAESGSAETGGFGEPADSGASAPGESGDAPAETAEAGDVPFERTEDGRYVIPKDKWDQASADAQFGAKIRERFPTFEDAEQAQNLSQQFDEFSRDWLGGGPNGRQQILDYLSGRHAPDPSFGAVFQRSFADMVKELPGYVGRSNPAMLQELHQAAGAALDQINPGAAQQAHASYLNGLFNDLYSEAVRNNDPVAFRRLQTAQWVISGNYPETMEEAKRGVAVQPPMARQPIAQPFQGQPQARSTGEDVQQRETALRESQWKIFREGSVDAARGAALDQEIQAAVEPLKANIDPKTLPYVMRGIRQDVVSRLQADQRWLHPHNANIEILKQQFMPLAFEPRQARSATQQYVNAIVSEFRNRLKLVVPSVVREQLSPQPGKPAARAAARTQLPAPRTNNGVPPPRVNRTPPGTQDNDAEFDKILRGALRA